MNLIRISQPKRAAFLSLCIGCFATVVTSLAAQQSSETEPVPNANIAVESGEDPEPIDQYPLADLPPLRRLVLYNSGVGQMQHEGEVTGKQRFEIRFGAKDVDDVLKSLVFADEGGGSIRAVEYQPAPEPEDMAASRVGMPMTLAQLVQKFRGESITVTVGSTQKKGVVYGVENRTIKGEIKEVIVLLTEGGLQTVDLQSIDQLQFDKAELRKTLSQAMQGIVRSRKANQKQLDLLFDGEGTRKVRFAYVVDVPIWRMTYRLAINEDKVYLQGWAHVDNVTGVDWEQVEMELRSGKPQSFRVNIFAPLLAERTNFGTGVYEFTEGLMLLADWVQETFDSGGFGGGGLGGGGFGGGGNFGGGRPARGPKPRRGQAGVDIESAFRTAAQESRSAQMVRYKLESPVDLGAGRSAALPVFSSEVPASLISVFDVNDEGSPFAEPQSPFRAVRITNTTDYSIVSGPLSLMRDGDFVGDGKLGRLDVDQETEIIYGLDRAVEIENGGETSQDKLTRIELNSKRGFVLHTQSTTTRKFTIANRDTEARTIVMYLADPGDPEVSIEPKPELVDDRLRFKVEIPARTDKEFVVIFRLNTADSKGISGSNAAIIKSMNLTDVELEEGLTEVLDELVADSKQLREMQAQRSKFERARQKLIDSQARVRENLKILNADSEAAKPFLKKFQELEVAIEEASSQIAEQSRAIAAEEVRQSQRRLEYGKDAG